jgi:hypothetical protein
VVCLTKRSGSYPGTGEVWASRPSCFGFWDTFNANGYDGFDNLRLEWQSLHAAIASNSPKIDYEWDFSAADAGNYNRLDYMTYPNRLNSPVRRTIDLQYGDAGGKSRDIVLPPLAAESRRNGLRAATDFRTVTEAGTRKARQK